jgi:undecaprenyl-diphosphatase
MHKLPMISLAAGAGTLALALATTTRVVQSADDALERRAIRARRRPRVLRASRIGTLPGEPYAHPTIAAAAAATILLARGGDARRVLLPLAAASVGAIALHHGVKLVYRRPRPEIALRRGKTEPAYPSGHTTDATAVLATSAYLLVREGVLSSRVALPIAALLALTTGSSRVLLGWHWGSDVAGGWLAGGGIAAGCAALYEALVVRGER